MIKTVLSRSWDGQDSWCAYKESVGIDSDGCLYYRRTEGDNCEYGEWNECENEEKALKFIFGNIELSKELVLELKKCLQQCDDLGNDVNMNTGGYVTNCIIIRRKDDESAWLFYNTPDGKIIPCLDSYAIIPREEYEDLLLLKKESGNVR